MFPADQSGEQALNIWNAYIATMSKNVFLLNSICKVTSVSPKKESE